MLVPELQRSKQWYSPNTNKQGFLHSQYLFIAGEATLSSYLPGLRLAIGPEGTWVNFFLDMCRWPLRAPTSL